MVFKKKISNEKPISEEEISSDSFNQNINNDEVMEEGEEESVPKEKEERKDVALITSISLLQDGSIQTTIVSSFQFGVLGKPYGRFNLD